MRRKEMLIYRNFPGQEIFDGMRDIIECGYRENVYQTLNSLIELANLHGFEGNVWHFFLAYVLANHENAFSTSCEIRGHVEGSINDMRCRTSVSSASSLPTIWISWTPSLA